MLLCFRAINARSFREKTELSLLATRMSDESVVRKVPWRQKGQSIGVLPAAGIFGANASGKSNLLRAMRDMRTHVVSSFRQGTRDSRMPNWSFRLGKDQGKSPTTYEVDLVLDGIRHEYGFQLDSSRVLSEWACRYPHGREALLFRREQDEVELPSGQRAKAQATLGILRSNALFLSAAAAADHPTFLPLFAWFQRNLIFADVQTRTARQALTAELLDRDDQRQQVLELLREADLGITGVEKRELDPEIRDHLMRVSGVLRGEEDNTKAQVNVEFDDFEVRLVHQAGSDRMELSPGEESLGTLVWFGMIGPVLEALRDGTVLLADELDASLHPTLVYVLVALFQSKRSNPRRAQLIFNSHDLTLMGDSSEHRLGRDQIWFTEKDEDGGTHLYPLIDHEPRKGEAIGRRYLAGRYGATPIVSIRHLERIAEPVRSDED